MQYSIDPRDLAVVEAFFTGILSDPIQALELYMTRGVRPATRNIDDQRLRPFLEQFETLSQLSQLAIDEWLAGKEHLSFATRQSYAQTLKAYCNWCVRNQNVSMFKSPAEHLRVSKRRSARPKAVSKEDVMALIAYLESLLPEPAAIRDLLALRLFVESGNRLTEVATLQMRSMRQAIRRQGHENSNGTIIYTVYSSDGKKGGVPVRFTEKTAELFRQWETMRPLGGNRVFVSLRPGDEGDPLKPNGVTQIILRRCREADITPFRTHAIRHLKGTITTDEYGPAVAASLLNISFEIAQTHYYDATYKSVLDAAEISNLESDAESKA